MGTSYFSSSDSGDAQGTYRQHQSTARARRSGQLRRGRTVAGKIGRRPFRLESLESRQLLAVDTLNPLVLERGDVNDNGTLEAGDIDLLSDRVRAGVPDLAFDVNRDGAVNGGDRQYWIETVHRTYVGDSNLDGQFGTSDLVLVFQAGRYEDGILGSADWRSGDWDGNRDFDTRDLVAAFQNGGFEDGPRPFDPLTLHVSDTVGPSQPGHFRTPLADVQVQGEAEPFTLVTLRHDAPGQGQDTETTVPTDAQGRFEFARADLQMGANRFELHVIDANGSRQTTSLTITRISSSAGPHDYAPWGDTVKAYLDDSMFPPSLATAFVPTGMTRSDMVKQLTSLASSKPLLGRPAQSLAPTAFDVTESEPSNTTGVNDTIGTAELIAGLGTGSGEESSVTIDGVLLPIPTPLSAVEDDGDIPKSTETNLTANHAVIFNEMIGDGPHGSAGTGSGDADFFVVRNVQQGQRITVDVTTPASSALDSFVFILDSTGDRIDFGDDDGISTDSFVEYVAEANGDYYISIAAFGSFGPTDPFNSATGIGAASEGEYEVIIGLDLPDDVDVYALQLEAGDILGATVTGGGSHLTLRDAQGNELVGSPQDASFVYPAISPLPRDGRASLSWTVDTPGTYYIAVDAGVGNYELDVAAFRPYLETQTRNTRQTLFLDFDGATLSPSTVFGLGPDQSDFDPLVSFLPGWGLTAADEDAVIDAITATVVENFQDIGLLGSNGDRATDGIDGNYQLDIITSRDLLDASGFPFDPFGAANVSRIVVGGTIEQLGLETIGLAESVDPGNFNSSETAVVLLDLLSAAVGEISSLNQFALAPGVSIIDLIGVAVGNIVTHEAGHFFGSWHTNQFNSVFDMMDQGGNLEGTIGLGPDRIFGTADDIDVDFGFDTFVPNEGFTGGQSSLNTTAIALSTGLVDPGMIVVETVPEDNRLISVPPTEFIIRFLDPYDATQPISPASLTVNGVPADQVILSGPTELTFRFNITPVVTQGLQQMQLAAGAVDRASDGSPVAAYSAVFGFDGTFMNVESVNPPGGIVQLPFGNIQVTFSEPYDPESVGTDDLTLNLGQVVGVNLIDADTVEYVIGNLVEEGELVVTMPTGAVSDQFGNSSTGFTTIYTLEIGTVPVTTPLEPKLPLGSLIYDPVMTGSISSDPDVDIFTILVDPGQSISVVLETDSQLIGEIDLFRGNRLVGFDEALGPGESVIIQNDPATGKLISVNDQPTLFSIHVTGKGASTGQYQLKVLLNAAFEEESYGFPLNDIRAGAQNVEPAFRSLRGNSPDVASVLGAIRGALTAQDDFESGDMDPGSWTVRSSTDNGQIRVTGSFGTADGRYALMMDTIQPGEANLNEAIWTVDLDGQSSALLSFAHVSFGDEPESFGTDFPDNFAADGIAISNDGNRWFPIFNAPSSTAGQWLNYELDLAEAVTANGLSLDDPLHIKFQQFDDQPIDSDGRGWDAIQIRHRDNADWYRIELGDGDGITLATTAQNGGKLQVELYDADGNLVAEGLKRVEPVVNGGFESGSLAGWQVSSSGGSSTGWSVSGAGYGGNLAAEQVAPQEGNFVAWSDFDGDGPLETTLYQDVTIPAGSPQAELSWAHRIQWLYLSDDHSGRTFELQIRDPATNQVLATPFSFSTPADDSVQLGDTNWQTPAVDLSAYIGSTVRLAFVQSIPDSFAGPGQIQLDQVELDLGQVHYENVTDVINGHEVVDTSDHFVRVTGDQGTDYTLLMTRNVSFNLESNDDMDSAQSLGPQTAGRRWMMGHLQGESDASDFYVMRALRPIDIETFTPAGAEGEFVNLLDPMIRIYDIHGNLLAEDDNSNEGVNAALQFHPTGESDIFFIEVLAVPHDGVPGTGEYVLAVRGADLVALEARPLLAASRAAGVSELAGAMDGEFSSASDSGVPEPTSIDELSTASPSERPLTAAAVDWLMAESTPDKSDLAVADADGELKEADLLADVAGRLGDPLKVRV